MQHCLGTRDMKKIALVFYLISCNAFAADVEVVTRSHQSTTALPNSRFEIVQSTLAAKWTFRVDKFTGRVWQLVKTQDDDNTWEEMQVLEKPTVQTPNRSRFQLFTSAIAARHTFFIDSDTGKTWLVVNGKRKDKDGTEIEYNLWQPFANQ